jgi:hypothetical protein
VDWGWRGNERTRDDSGAGGWGTTAAQEDEHKMEDGSGNTSSGRRSGQLSARCGDRGSAGQGRGRGGVAEGRRAREARQ